jgi:hypothetical protein
MLEILYELTAEVLNRMFGRAARERLSPRKVLLSRAAGCNFRDRRFLSVLTSSLAKVLTLALLLQLGATALGARGTGEFAAGSNVEAGVPLNTWDISLGDLNGDGNLDLITGNAITNTPVRKGFNEVYLGNGSGAFGAGSDVEAGVTLNTYSTSLGDLDGDLDLVIGNRLMVNRVYWGNGSGAYAVGSELEGGVALKTYGLVLAD